MTAFPTIDTASRMKGYSDEYSDDAVNIAGFDSGYPCINELFTFDPRTFRVYLQWVSQDDKEIVMEFYQASKGVPFHFFNDQSSEVFEVVFTSKPNCSISDDDDKDSWDISFSLLQSSSEVYTVTSGTYGYGPYGEGIYVGS